MQRPKPELREYAKLRRFMHKSRSLMNQEGLKSEPAPAVKKEKKEDSNTKEARP